MTRRFVVATDPLTPEQEKKFQESISNAGWWHWLPNFWLFKDYRDEHTTDSIRDILFKMDSTKRCIVLQVDRTTWSAVTKKDEKGRDMVQWIKDIWQVEP
ncbi:MAG TPA: hypothetical protein VMF90_19005 [Rhizobiaceae bacterium]|nr:hypothetical protein [Rhizobiaceae bacterium]